MPIHDAYARVTPFERAFPDDATATERMERIRQDVAEEETSGALRDPGRFLSLPAVAEVVHGIRDPGSGGEEVQKHGIFLYHAFHFHEAGRPLFFLTTGAARYLVETAPGSGEGEKAERGEGAKDGAEGDDPGDEPVARLPDPAGYLQLPRQLFWMEPGGDAVPEPVDGIFWASPDGERLSLLVIGGMRDDRPGFSVVPLPPVPLEDAGAWLRTQVRETGTDFETTLPGGDLERLYSFETTGEVLKLVARAFRYVECHSDAVTDEPAPDAEGAGGADEAEGAVPEGGGAGDRGATGPGRGESEPDPTAFPYRRVHLEDQPAAYD